MGLARVRPILRATGSLGQLAAGASRQDILEDYPYLEDADIDAVLAFAARQADYPIIAAERVRDF